MATKNITPESASPSTIQFTEYEQIFNQDLSMITAIVREKYHTPSTPIDIYLEEAEGIYEVLTRKLEELKKEGFKDSYAQVFYRAIASGRIAQALMKTNIDQQQANTLQFKILYPEAVSLRERLLSRIAFIIDGNPQKTAIIDTITKGSRISDTIQDLLELGKLGEGMLLDLQELNVTVDETNRAKELATTLGRIHKASSIDGKIHSESRIIRDKAITLLEEAHIVIKKWAKLVYKHDLSTRRQFFSSYTRMKSHQSYQRKIHQNTKSSLQPEGGSEVA